MSYVPYGLHGYGAADLTAVKGAIKPTVHTMVALDKKYEAIAKELQDIDPTGTLATYFAIQAVVLKIAAELGIEKEVTTIYHAGTSGAKVGTAAGTAAAQIATYTSTGTTALAGSAAVASAAAMGMVAGGLVGVVAGIISLFDDDDEDEARRKARVAARKALEAYMLSRLDLNGLINEQQTAEAYARSQAKSLDWMTLGPSTMGITSPMAKKAATRKKSMLDLATNAQKMAALFITVGDLLKPHEVALFVSMANIARWEQSLARYDKEVIPQLIASLKKASKPGPIGTMPGPNLQVLGLQGTLQNAMELAMKLRMNIVTEKAKLPKVPVPALGIRPALFANVLKQPALKIPMIARSGVIVKPVSAGGWVLGLLAVAATGGAGYYYYTRRRRGRGTR